MIRYNSPFQLTISEFVTPFEKELSKTNRWVVLAGILPWDRLASIYHKALCADFGAPSIDARIVIGALIIKHKMSLDDRGVVEMVGENPYMQYFLGLKGFKTDPIFDPSLFVTFRKRIGDKLFDEMNMEIIRLAEQRGGSGKKGGSKRGNGSKTPSGADKSPVDEPAPGQEEGTKTEVPGATLTKNKGLMMVDATVADQYIPFPTDLDLLSTSREEAERLIDVLCSALGLPEKPRTYRKVARKAYLDIAKKKVKTKKEIRKGIRRQLQYLNRDIGHINKLLDAFDTIPFTKRDYKIWLVVQHIYLQQKEMFDKKTNTCTHRIVNVYQPYVRPIVRGKTRNKIEFGAKLSVSLENGYARLDRLSWEAFNEGGDLIMQVEAYRGLHGHYPEVVVTDKIYGTRENRNWLKNNGIRFCGKPLGRPPKEELSLYQKSRQRKEQRSRNQIEGKFGEGKNGFNLNRIRAKLRETSESWIATIIFVMNINQMARASKPEPNDFWPNPVHVIHLLLSYCKNSLRQAHKMKQIVIDEYNGFAYVPAFFG